MANQPPDVLTQFAMPDPNAAPLTLIQLFQLANTLVSSEIQGPYLSYILQVNEPGSSDQDKVWVQLDSQRRPVAIKTYYNGHWRRVYNGMLGEIRGYTGNPNTDFDLTGDNPGLGKIEGNYDGWRLCNGKGGTPDLSDKFIIGAHMNNLNAHPGCDHGWQTFVDGKSDLKTGGVISQLIEMKHLPPLDNSGPDPLTGAPAANGTGLYIHGKEAKESDAHGEVRPLVDIHYANALPHDAFLIKYGSDPHGNPAVPQEKFPVIPPFYALAWITFVGYAS
jgi:hypothetical protein